MKPARNASGCKQGAFWPLRSVGRLLWLGRILQAKTLMAFMFVLSGCSVGMAVAGDEQPRLVVAQAGTSKEVIDAEFGLPAEIKVRDDGGAEWVGLHGS